MQSIYSQFQDYDVKSTFSKYALWMYSKGAHKSMFSKHTFSKRTLASPKPCRNSQTYVLLMCVLKTCVVVSFRINLNSSYQHFLRKIIFHATVCLPNQALCVFVTIHLNFEKFFDLSWSLEFLDGFLLLLIFITSFAWS